MENYVSQEYIKDEMIENREYQEDIYQNSQDKNTLICLPTGLGKTPVAIRVILQKYATVDVEYPQVVLVAPTTNLVSQHAESFEELTEFTDTEIAELTGDIQPPNKRGDMFDNNDIIVATPQALQNDLVNGRVSLENVVSFVFDECHHATGDHSYPYLAEKYNQQNPDGHILGLSASPGDDEESIKNICENLFLDNIEMRSRDSDDVQEYVYKTEMREEWLELSEETNEIRENLLDVLEEITNKLDEVGVLDTQNPRDYGQKITQKKSQALRGRVDDKVNGSDKGLAYSFIAEARTLNSLQSLISTHGPEPFLDRFESLQNKVNRGDGSKADERLINRVQVQRAVDMAKNHEQYTSKQLQLVREVTDILPDGQAMVFVDNRDTISWLVDFFNSELDGVSAQKLVGKSSSANGDGMSKSEQREVIQEFEDGEFDVLLATRVGEEGLDLPSVDLVVFFEPAPRGIRDVQRSGRTGRHDTGEVVIFIAKDTKDVPMYYKSQNQIESMQQSMEELQNVEEILEEEQEQQSLDDFGESEDDVSAEDIESEIEEVEVVEEDLDLDEEDTWGGENDVIVTDSRESQSKIIRNLDLEEDNVTINFETLSVADYIVGPGVAVERKSISDLRSTITGDDRDLFQQIFDMTNNFDTGILLIEGSLEEMYSSLRKETMIGLQAALTMLDVEIVHTTGEEETRKYLVSLASRLQEDETGGEQIRTHAKKSQMDPNEEQVYVISSMKGIGKQKAERLLEEFNTIQNVFTASKDELLEVEGIGKGNADRIIEFSQRKYE